MPPSRKGPRSTGTGAEAVPCPVPTRRLRIALAAFVTLIALAGCTRPAPRPAPGPAPVNLVADTIVDAARATIDRINAAAGGAVADQRAILDRIVAPGEADAQQRCPEARTTLAFDPAYRDLRPAPGGARDEYLLPTYITIYTGGRITGSDVANIRLWIDDGTARTAALCVS